MDNKFNIGTEIKASYLHEPLLADYEAKEPANTVNNKQIIDKDGTVYILDELGEIKESSKPTVKGQFKKENLWRYGAPQAIVLNLSNPEELDKYNSILKETAEEDPSAVLIDSTKEFWNGQFIMLVTWCPIMYLTLIKK